MNGKQIAWAVRHLRTNKMSSFINIFGLGIGLGTTLLMGIYILHEFSFDKYHQNSETLCRIIIDNSASTPYAMGEHFKENVTGVEKIFRIYDLWNVQTRLNEEFVKEDGFLLTDKEFFSLLDIPLVLGNRNHLFDNTSDVVISDKIKEKYFPHENPVGKTIKVSISGRIVNFTVTGVYQHFPSNSSIQANWIGNIEEAFPVLGNIADPFQKISKKELNQLKQNWDKGGFQTIVSISKNADIAEIEKQCTQTYQDHSKKEKIVKLQSFNQMYLHSDNISNTPPFKTSQLSILKIYAGIAGLILLVACINYILLSLADAKKQLKQVACRKINGASVIQIQKQHLFQSMLMSFLSIIPGIIFLLIIIPFFNQLFDKNLTLGLLVKAPYLLMLFALIIFTGLTSGLYISYYTSRINPSQLISPKNNRIKNRNYEKGILIVSQFVIFILLCSSTLIMKKQLLFINHKYHGFNTDNIVIVRLDNKDAQRQVSTIKSKLKQIPHVKMIGETVLTPPSQDFWQLTVSNGDKGKLDEEGLFIGANLLSTLQIPIIEGQDFSENGNTNELIVNEAAAKKYQIKAGEYYGKFFIQAIVSNFHAHSLHRSIKPLLLFKTNSEHTTQLVIRTDGYNQEVVDNLKLLWKEVLPYSFLEYEILNDRIASFYKKEMRQTKSVMFFAFMAILLAGLGLFGYVSQALMQRTKEIGVRKVNGAHSLELLEMLNKDFIKWLLFAFIIATPISWYAMTKWLQNFAYKTEISWWVFAMAGTIALVIALITVSWQSWRAASKNPIEALRYE